MILVDTNVLIDILSSDTKWTSWSTAALQRQSCAGGMLINEVVYAELAARYPTQHELDVVVATFALDVKWLPKPALCLAVRSFGEYRRSGGVGTNILADFFIGAHAAVAQIPILTRDPRRYRTYFPAVELITP